jgi:hypothetical protein
MVSLVVSGRHCVYLLLSSSTGIIILCCTYPAVDDRDNALLVSVDAAARNMVEVTVLGLLSN